MQWIVFLKLFQSYNTVFGTFSQYILLGTKSSNLCWCAAQKNCACASRVMAILGYRRLDITMYGESSAEVCPSSAMGSFLNFSCY